MILLFYPIFFPPFLFGLRGGHLHTVFFTLYGGTLLHPGFFSFLFLFLLFLFLFVFIYFYYLFFNCFFSSPIYCVVDMFFFGGGVENDCVLLCFCFIVFCVLLCCVVLIICFYGIKFVFFVLFFCLELFF